MSKAVKDLLTRDLKSQLSGVSEALLVNVIGLNSLRTSKLRTELRKKNIKLEVIKNSMARRRHRRHAAGAGVRRSGRHAGRCLGQRRFCFAGQGNGEADRSERI